MKKLFIKTYGCQMNVYDSARMGDLLKPFGYQISEDETTADLLILNTCHIREKASEKLYSELGRIRQYKNEKASRGEEMIVAVAGCVAQAEGEEVLRRARFVDIVVGPQSYQTLPDLLSKLKRERTPQISLEFPEHSKFDQLPANAENTSIASFLSVQEGCDKFCTFCVVPYTRGSEYSRPFADIYREAADLVSRGAREISLLGQNVNAYHGKTSDDKECNLGDLIFGLAKIDGLERIRYTTSHPNDMHESLYRAHENEPKLMPYLHLPVQSGSNQILQKMNRKHTRESYFRVIERLRSARPDIEFSSDFIVGFPGETDSDFNDTMDLIRQVRFAQAYSFKYSPRPGTPAAEREDQIPEEVKSERLQILQAELIAQQRAINNETVGKTLPVLFEKQGRKPGQIIGKTPYMQAAHIDLPEGRPMPVIAQVKIISTGAYSLAGELVS